MSLHIKEFIKAKAMKEHKDSHKSTKSMHLEGKKSIFVDNEVATFLKKLSFGMQEHIKEKSETILVDTRVCEFFKALHLCKEEKITVGPIRHHIG